MKRRGADRGRALDVAHRELRGADEVRMKADERELVDRGDATIADGVDLVPVTGPATHARACDQRASCFKLVRSACARGQREVTREHAATLTRKQQ